MRKLLIVLMIFLFSACATTSQRQITREEVREIVIEILAEGAQAKKVTDLGQLSEPSAVDDMAMIVDVSDATMAVTGTNKKIEVQDFTAYYRQQITKTANYVIGTDNARECYGGIFDNQGDAGAQVLTLCDAEPGMVVTVVLDEAQDIDINPNGNERILVLTNANGDAISSDATQGSMITLFAISATEWMPVGYIGVWTDAN